MIQREYTGKPILEYVSPNASIRVTIPTYVVENGKEELLYAKNADGTFKYDTNTGLKSFMRSLVPFQKCELRNSKNPDSRDACNYIIYEGTPDWIKKGIEDIKKSMGDEILTRDEYEEKFHFNSYKIRQSNKVISEKDAEITALKTKLAGMSEMEKKLANYESKASSMNSSFKK